MKTRGRVLVAGRVAKERSEAVGRVLGTDVAIERSITGGSVVVAAYVDVECLFASSGVVAAHCVVPKRSKTHGSVIDAGCEVEESILALGGGSVWIASVRWWIHGNHARGYPKRNARDGQSESQ